MWDAFYNSNYSQSCTVFCKKKTDLLSVEYTHYIHKDVLNYLDQYPMRQSNQKLKKGSPKNRSKQSKTKAPTKEPICKIGPVCKCLVKPKEEFVTSPTCLKLTEPARRTEKQSLIASTEVQKSSGDPDVESHNHKTEERVGSNILRVTDSLYSDLNEYNCRDHQEHSKIIENSEIHDHEPPCVKLAVCEVSLQEYSFKSYVPPWKTYKVSL